MYVCMYVCEYVCTYVCVYVCVRVCDCQKNPGHNAAHVNIKKILIKLIKYVSLRKGMVRLNISETF